MQPQRDARFEAGPAGRLPPDLRIGPGLRIGLVGPGRVGSVLAGGLAAAGVEVPYWCGPTGRPAHTDTDQPAAPDASTLWMAAAAPLAVRTDLGGLLGSVDLVLLAVPDRELAPLARRLADEPGWAGRAVWHVSGAAGLAPLAPLVAAGAAGLALHPAMTFTGSVSDLARLAGITWARTTTPGWEAFADALVATLGGVPIPVADEHRAVYHAALSHASNFFTVLEAQAADLLRSIGVAEPAAVLAPLAQAALANAFTDPPVFTGPLSRGDDRSIAAHLQLLAEREPAALRAYACLTEAAVRRAAAAGVLDAEQAERVLVTLARSASPGPGT